MPLTSLKASLLALSLAAAAGPALSAESTVPGTIVVAQAEDDGDGAGGSQRVETVRKFLASANDLSRLDEKRLNQRQKRARRFQNVADLPPDLASGLEQEIAAIDAELAKRQAGGAASGESTEAAGQDDDGASASAAGTKKAGKQQTAQNDTGEDGASEGSQGAGSTASVADFLTSARPASELDQQELRQQMREANRLSRTKGISREDRQKLRKIMREARSEMARKGGGQKASNAGNDDDSGGGDDGDGGGNADQSVSNGGAADAREPVTDDGQQSGSAQGGNAEQRAQALLRDGQDAADMDRDRLRKRLATMRELLASNTLSPETTRALRQKLASDRTVLRRAVSSDGGGNGQSGSNQGGGSSASSGGDVTINNNTTVTSNQQTVRVVLADRRPSRDLDERDLRRRINVYRDVVLDKNYPEDERRRIRVILDQDRVVLRQRLLDDRRKRQARLRDRNDLDIDLSLNFQPNRPRPPRSVFAAEAEDEELEDVLAAPPRREIDRRYSVEEVESDPELRDAVARIEIDTVRFGFGEGFLREEEVENLDRIAEVMERILTVNAGEVFMIEGHTDAVGSDGANLELSRERARAVKEALSTYYVIPEENLKTVGFGERYLKIPTEDPEAENRRVSIARITPLVGALEE